MTPPDRGIIVCVVRPPLLRSRPRRNPATNAPRTFADIEAQLNGRYDSLLHLILDYYQPRYLSVFVEDDIEDEPLLCPHIT